MKRLLAFLFALSLSVTVVAQHRGGGGSGGARGFSSGSRGGSVGAFRGGGGASYRSYGGYTGAYRGGYSTALRGGYGYGGGRGYGGYGRGWYGRGWGFGIYGWPYAYGPGYYGYGYGGWDPYDYGYYGSGYYAPSYSYAPAESQSPVVVVNQQPPQYDYPSYSQSRGPEQGYEQGSAPPAPSYRPTIYKIAFTDHKIVSALAYWVADGQLHYVTMDHAMREVPLSSIDRRFSEQLNRDQGVPFRLPAEGQ
jgi:hypothetical protein